MMPAGMGRWTVTIVVSQVQQRIIGSPPKTTTPTAVQALKP
jgi:hypothetical protein